MEVVPILEPPIGENWVNMRTMRILTLIRLVDIVYTSKHEIYVDFNMKIASKATYPSFIWLNSVITF